MSAADGEELGLFEEHRALTQILSDLRACLAAGDPVVALPLAARLRARSQALFLHQVTHLAASGCASLAEQRRRADRVLEQIEALLAALRTGTDPAVPVLLAGDLAEALKSFGWCDADH